MTELNPGQKIDQATIDTNPNPSIEATSEDARENDALLPIAEVDPATEWLAKLENLKHVGFTDIERFYKEAAALIQSATDPQSNPGNSLIGLEIALSTYNIMLTIEQAANHKIIEEPSADQTETRDYKTLKSGTVQNLEHIVQSIDQELRKEQLVASTQNNLKKVSSILRGCLAYLHGSSPASFRRDQSDTQAQIQHSFQAIRNILATEDPAKLLADANIIVDALQQKLAVIEREISTYAIAREKHSQLWQDRIEQETNRLITEDPTVASDIIHTIDATVTEPTVRLEAFAKLLAHTKLQEPTTIEWLLGLIEDLNGQLSNDATEWCYWQLSPEHTRELVAKLDGIRKKKLGRLILKIVGIANNWEPAPASEIVAPRSLIDIDRLETLLEFAQPSTQEILSALEAISRIGDISQELNKPLLELDETQRSVFTRLIIGLVDRRIQTRQIRQSDEDDTFDQQEHHVVDQERFETLLLNAIQALGLDEGELRTVSSAYIVEKIQDTLTNSESMLLVTPELVSAQELTKHLRKLNLL